MTVNVSPAISADLSLNAIVALQPRALDLFNRLGLDSCCGGAKTLAVVCAAHELRLDDVLRDLHALTDH